MLNTVAVQCTYEPNYVLYYLFNRLMNAYILHGITKI